MVNNQQINSLYFFQNKGGKRRKDVGVGPLVGVSCS